VSFAEHTTVSVEKSKAELDALLKRAGAAQRVIGDDDAAGTACAGFTIGKDGDRRMVRITLPLPKASAFARVSVRGKVRDATPEEQARAHEQACRARWRCMVLLVKAKLEAVALGVSTLEREFLADVYLPSGETVGQVLSPKLAIAYETGTFPPMLGMGGAP
jgi:hypothetical protein